LIRQLQEDAQSLGQLLRSNDRTHVSWVTLAEQLSVEETMDALAWLSAEHMTVGRIIVNGIRPVPVGALSLVPCRAATPTDGDVAARHAYFQLAGPFGPLDRSGARPGEGTGRPARPSVVGA
jgi:anion-transporting  ArsA/GET3 family ATPase